jgi:hypothetical protein
MTAGHPNVFMERWNGVFVSYELDVDTLPESAENRFSFQVFPIFGGGGDQEFSFPVVQKRDVSWRKQRWKREATSDIAKTMSPQGQ